MSTLSDIKTALREMLPSGQRLKVDKHKEVNDKLLDYMFIPFGVPFPYLGITIPSNCSKCDGKLLNKVNYPYLFDELGNKYGELLHGTLGGYDNGDGITTFNLPYIQPGASLIQSGTDAISKVIFTLGLNSASNDVNTFITGEVTHKLTKQESGIPTHFIGQRVLSSTGTDADYEGITNGTGSPQLTVQGAAAESPHNNMPPFIVCNWIMRLY